tara:strand:+ start:530 stop:1015 length:486 start_codon:yes stop_codon:yes gene_type:complete
MNLHQLLRNYQINYQLPKLKPIMSAKIMNALAAKYGFDAKEAKKHLISEGLIKAPKKREASPKAEKSVTKKASKEDNSKPKRAMSGYNLYYKTERPIVKIELDNAAEESGEEVKSKDIMSAVAERWKALDDDEKKIWRKKAIELHQANFESDSNSDTEDKD